ncbi:hypothetical protein Tco_1576833 [Tanacetum coccineum]
MASLDHRLNPLFSIKKCMSCGALYTRNCGCSKGGLEDKILVPKPLQNCATCGNPVDGLNCQSYAFVRKCLNEGWYTIRDENEIPNTSESSKDNTNCGDSLDDIFCQRCTCKSCGNGAHIGYNYPPKAPIISNPEQCNQTINELPQTLPSVHPTFNSEDKNSFIYDSKPNSFNDSPSVFTHPPQLQFETYLCEFVKIFLFTFVLKGKLSRRPAYTTLSNPQGVIYKDKLKRKRFMRADELHKFSDGTLISVRDTLDQMLHELHLGYNTAMRRRLWTKLDQQRTRIMIKAINQKLLDRRIMRSFWWYRLRGRS